MDKQKNKELIIDPQVPVSELNSFLQNVVPINIIKIDPKHKSVNSSYIIIYESDDADIVISNNLDDFSRLKSLGKEIAFYKKVLSNDDIDEIEKASHLGANYVIVDANDWKIIPLENIIARLQNTNTKIFTTARNSEEVRTLFTVLELGVDGVILSTNSKIEIENSMKFMKNLFFPIQSAKIIEIKDVGTGERVCVDTVSILENGEGMLVGSKSNFLFLVHNESFGSAFTSPRPFRVNAGAVYCYTVLPDGTTQYLSELESGNEILVINKSGSSRRVTVGRSKIETRPLKLIKGLVKDGLEGTVIVQNAETIQFITKDGKLLPVTEIKKGDEVLCSCSLPTGRHFGMKVQEYIVEK